MEVGARAGLPAGGEGVLSVSCMESGFSPITMGADDGWLTGA